VSKLERLLNLTAVLLDTGRPLTAEQIRGQVEGYPPPGSAFHRAFERDKDALRASGIPVRVERAPATDPPIDGYRIDPEEYYLPDPDLESDELAALHLATLAVRTEGLGAHREALWKLGGLIDTGAAVVDQSVASLPIDPVLVPLFQAICDRRRVSFLYRDVGRTVDPWRLGFHRGRWYLTGFDHLRGEERNYRLDRIEGLAPTGEAATETAPPRAAGDDPLPPPWELGEDEPVIARLVVDADHALLARRQLGPAAEATERSDGSAEFAVPVVNYDAFRTFLFGLLDHAELVAPDRWRSDVVAWLEGIEAGDG
jgi:predicted DNA-binding transcriptional regulator YafY